MLAAITHGRLIRRGAARTGGIVVALIGHLAVLSALGYQQAPEPILGELPTAIAIDIVSAPAPQAAISRWPVARDPSSRWQESFALHRRPARADVTHHLGCTLPRRRVADTHTQPALDFRHAEGRLCRDATGWLWATVAMAGLIIVLTVPFGLTREPQSMAQPQSAHRPSLGFALSRSEVRYGLLLTAAFEIGVRLTQGMIGPFLVDAGLDLSTLGILNGVGGTIAGLAGTFLGGVIVRWCGPRRAVLLAATLQATVLILLALAVVVGIKSYPVLVTITILHLSIGVEL